MKTPKHLRDKILRLIFISGIFLPFLVASYTSQIIGASIVGMALVFCAVFMFSFFSYWIVLRAIMQILDE